MLENAPVAVDRRDRLLAGPGSFWGQLTGPSPVDRARAGSKHHLITELRRCRIKPRSQLRRARMVLASARSAGWSSVRSPGCTAPPLAGALRAPRRHPPGVPPHCLRADLLQAAADGCCLIFSACLKTQRTRTPTATFTAARATARGASPRPIAPVTSSVVAHPTAPAKIAHRRPIMSPTNSIVGITHQVSHRPRTFGSPGASC